VGPYGEGPSPIIGTAHPPLKRISVSTESLNLRRVMSVEPVNHASWLDAWGRELVVLFFLDPAFSSLRYSVVNHLKSKGSGLHAIHFYHRVSGRLLTVDSFF
jgi:hypothetical protein